MSKFNLFSVRKQSLEFLMNNVALSWISFLLACLLSLLYYPFPLHLVVVAVVVQHAPSFSFIHPATVKPHVSWIDVAVLCASLQFSCEPEAEQTHRKQTWPWRYIFHCKCEPVRCGLNISILGNKYSNLKDIFVHLVVVFLHFVVGVLSIGIKKHIQKDSFI